MTFEDGKIYYYKTAKDQEAKDAKKRKTMDVNGGSAANGKEEKGKFWILITLNNKKKGTLRQIVKTRGTSGYQQSTLEREGTKRRRRKR